LDDELLVFVSQQSRFNAANTTTFARANPTYISESYLHFIRLSDVLTDKDIGLIPLQDSLEPDQTKRLFLSTWGIVRATTGGKVSVWSRDDLQLKASLSLQAFLVDFGLSGPRSFSWDAKGVSITNTERQTRASNAEVGFGGDQAPQSVSRSKCGTFTLECGPVSPNTGTSLITHSDPSKRSPRAYRARNGLEFCLTAHVDAWWSRRHMNEG
jgi:hypothetical protein